MHTLKDFFASLVVVPLRWLSGFIGRVKGNQYMDGYDAGYDAGVDVGYESGWLSRCEAVELRGYELEKDGENNGK